MCLRAVSIIAKSPITHVKPLENFSRKKFNRNSKNHTPVTLIFLSLIRYYLSNKFIPTTAAFPLTHQRSTRVSLTSVRPTRVVASTEMQSFSNIFPILYRIIFVSLSTFLVRTTRWMLIFLCYAI